MISSDFAIFILTHGRANNVVTYKTLQRLNYTGKLYILIDNEDDQEQEYRKIFGDKVIQFDKLEIAKRIDACDNFNNRTVILHARNACYEVAKKLGLKYFLMLDDDYTSICYRRYHCYTINHCFDDVCNAMIEFLKCSPHLMTVAWFQGGDIMGGKKNDTFRKGYKFKAMNSLFCKVDDYVQFKGTMNEDASRYVSQNMIGKLSLSTARIQVSQKPTQSTAGGITELYKRYGTYVKTFYSVINCPQAVKVSVLQSKNSRIHHKINFDACTVKILREEHKKKV